MRAFVVILVAGYLSVAALAAQSPSAEKKPENVQVLTGLSLREIRAEMMMMSDALDVKCGHCHSAGNFASDNNRNKVAAREMLRMTKALNEQYFGRAAATEGTTLGHVTCFTCHRGAARPVNSPAQLSTLTK
jgi:photosynthetic reaction center cytochrome c subunit